MSQPNPVTNTIFEQMGGRIFQVCTGARGFVHAGNTLFFRLPERFAKDRINLVRITLNAMDLYDVEFMRARGLNVSVIHTVGGVHVDMLRDIFERHTGLYTSLRRRV